MKHLTKYSLLLNVILIGIIILMHTCDRCPEPTPIIDTGEFPVAKPDESIVITPDADKSNGDNSIPDKLTPAQKFVDDNRPLIDSLLAENERIQREYDAANDSIRRLQFAERIALKAFSKTWEDDKMKLTVSGVARGEVMGMSADWEYTSQVPKPRNPWRIFARMEIGSTLDFGKVTLKPGIGVQTRSGQTFSASIDNDERIWVGAGLPVFTSK
jgi:hypothetical protein